MMRELYDGLRNLAQQTGCQVDKQILPSGESPPKEFAIAYSRPGNRGDVKGVLSAKQAENEGEKIVIYTVKVTVSEVVGAAPAQ